MSPLIRNKAHIVQRVSLPWLTDIVLSVEKLNAIKESVQMRDGWVYLFDAQSKVSALMSDSVYTPHLRICRSQADKLLINIKALLENVNIGKPDYVFTKVDEYMLESAANEFKMIFMSELTSVPSFLVSEKDNFDVNKLIEQGIGLFPRNLHSKVPEALEDAMEAGRALAFELPTGCGFHLFRVVEAVVRRYWDIASGGLSRPSLATLGNMAAEMEKQNFGEIKIVESIKQLTKLHRNPLIHPEVILSVEEAIGIAGMSRSVVGAILAVLPDVPTTTGGTGT
jgi:hypothetical protein